MIKELNAAQKALLDEIYEEVGIELEWVVLNEMPDDIDDMMEYAHERVHELEVIYYHTAMEYLKEHDPSLQESIGLAGEMGCELDSINSELLATLLLQQNAAESLEEYREQLDELFYSEPVMGDFDSNGNMKY